MYVLVDLEEEAVELVDPGDLDRVHLEVTGGFDEEAVDRLLVGLGRLETVESAYLSFAVLHVMARTSAGDQEWSERFDRLVSDARSRGEVDNTGAYLRVEVEWPPDTVA